MNDAPHRERRLSAEEEAEVARGMPLVLPTVPPGPPHWPTVFGRAAPLELELGFGRPHFLIERALEVPDHDVVGIEWKGRWPRQANRRAVREGIGNVRAVHGNAWLLTGALFGPASLSAIFLNFPDPWWKAKHQKRRIINETFSRVLVDRLAPGGTFLIQTDVASLLEEELEHLEALPGLRNEVGPGRLLPRKPVAASSHREKKCRADRVPIFRARLVREASGRNELAGAAAARPIA